MTQKLEKKNCQKKFIKFCYAKLFQIFSNVYFRTKCAKN